MSATKQIGLKLACILSLSLFLITCASIVPKNNEHISPSQLTHKDETPKSVVIMPFDNLTTENGLEILTRTSFYNHFSSKNYRDIELSEIDRGLEILEKSSSKSWKDLSASSIGKFFNADYIIYGKVREFKKIFLGIYSQLSLKVEVVMLDSADGELFWTKTVTKRSQVGLTTCMIAANAGQEY